METASKKVNFGETSLLTTPLSQPTSLNNARFGGNEIANALVNHAQANKAGASMIINEVLCFITNSFHKSLHNNIKATMLDFFTIEEITAANQLIYKTASEVTDSNNLTRLITRKASTNRLRLEIEDLFKIVTILDERHLL